MHQTRQLLAFTFISLLLSGCGNSSKESQEEVQLPELSLPAWLSNAQVELIFVEQSFDLQWQAFGYFSNPEEASSFSFDYGPTPTHDSNIEVQWNLAWVNGEDGAGYASPFIIHKVEGLTPGESYAPIAMAQVESNISLESFDGGMGPEFVIGAFSSAPSLVEEEGTGQYVLQVEGSTINRSADTATMGYVDIPEEFLHGEYVTNRVINDANSLIVTANDSGEIW